ncbi:MAG: alpha/beta fold hydrolase [Pseudomonadota bacterium]
MLFQLLPSKPLAAFLALLLGAILTLAGAVAQAAPLLTPSRFNNGSSVDPLAVGTRIPVLLVHGLGGGNEGWESFLRAYEKNPAWQAAFKPYSFSYSTSNSEVAADPTAPRTISALGGSLQSAMQAFYDKPTASPHFGFGNKRIVILAHSMGGLVARSMMQEHVFRDGRRGGDKVLHLITLATPHHGSPLADAALELGLQTVTEVADTWPGFLADLTWTNYDGLNMSGGRCNQWLARLNSYVPRLPVTGNGRCGTAPPSALPGYYERIVAYGARDLQTPDLQIGLGIFREGSSPSLLFSYGWLRNNLPIRYGNDGILPIASAQFDGAPLWKRAEAFRCDHRFIKRGYTQKVRTLWSSYSEWAFCAASAGDATYTSGFSGGYAVSGSIFGAPGGIIDIIRNASQAERVFNFAEVDAQHLLQPAGVGTEVGTGYLYRYYPATGAFLAVHEGNLYYLGPASGNQLYLVGSLAATLPIAERAGY